MYLHRLYGVRAYYPYYPLFVSYHRHCKVRLKQAYPNYRSIIEAVVRCSFFAKPLKLGHLRISMAGDHWNNETLLREMPEQVHDGKRMFWFLFLTSEQEAFFDLVAVKHALGEPQHLLACIGVGAGTVQAAWEPKHRRRQQRHER